MLGDEVSVVKATNANVFADGGERNNTGVCKIIGKSSGSEFGKGTSEGADGIEFKIMDENTDQFIALANKIGRRKIVAILAFTVFCGRFTCGTNGEFCGNDVIFTTVTKWSAESTATPTGMGCEEV